MNIMLLNDDLKEIVPLMYEKIREFPEKWKYCQKEQGSKMGRKIALFFFPG